MAMALEELAPQAVAYADGVEGPRSVESVGRPRLRLVHPQRQMSEGEQRPFAAEEARRYRMRVYRRRRLVAGFIVALVCAVVAAGLHSATDQPAAPVAVAELDARPSMVVIGEGGTIWQEVTPFTPVGITPHAWVAEVLEHNDVDAASLAAGSVIHLPAMH